MLSCCNDFVKLGVDVKAKVGGGAIFGRVIFAGWQVQGLGSEIYGVIDGIKCTVDVSLELL